MPSIMTLEGDVPRRRKRKSRSLGRTPEIGECKSVFNPRTKKSIQLCYVGKRKDAPTGWRFMKRR